MAALPVPEEALEADGHEGAQELHRDLQQPAIGPRLPLKREREEHEVLNR